MAIPAIAYPRQTPIAELRDGLFYPTRSFANFLELLAKRASVTVALLNSGSVSAAATLDIDLTGYTAYRGVAVVLDGFVPATDGVDLYLRFSSDGGATFDASGYNYAGNRTTDGGTNIAFGSGNAAQIAITGSAGIGNAATEGIHLDLRLLRQTSTALWGRVMFQAYAISLDVPPVGYTAVGGGAREAAQDTDAIRFLFSSGNIARGTWAVYGLP